jgi:[acyl-carrier-protein] S-malonyltransferase
VHGDVETIVETLVRQLHQPVQWTRCVQTLVGLGATRLVECGPGKALTGMAKRIDKSLEAKAIGTAADFDAALADWNA